MYKSGEGQIPEIDLRKLDHISSIVTTFEQKDLKANSVISYYFDKSTNIVFLELIADVNGKRITESIFGFDKEKIANSCKIVSDYLKGV